VTPLRYKTDTLDIPPLPRPSAKLLSTGLPTLQVSVPPPGGDDHDLVLDIASGFDQIIGRDDSADITVPEPTISRHHARITRDTDGVWIEDLRSTNGTYVNGRRVLDRARVRDSDEVKLGSAVAVFSRSDPAAGGNRVSWRRPPAAGCATWALGMGVRREYGLRCRIG
jgi:hypothetical protein